MCSAKLDLSLGYYVPYITVAKAFLIHSEFRISAGLGY